MSISWTAAPKYIFGTGNGYSRGELFIYEGELKLIVLADGGEMAGYRHNGTAWVSEPKWISGLTYTEWTVLTHFWQDGVLHMLECHNGWAWPTGKVWNPAMETWENETTYLAGINDLPIGGDIWYDGTVMRMILTGSWPERYNVIGYDWNPLTQYWDENPVYTGLERDHQFTVFWYEGLLRCIGFYNAPDVGPAGYTHDGTAWVSDQSITEGIGAGSNAVPSTIIYQNTIIMVLGGWFPEHNAAYTTPLPVPPVAKGIIKRDEGIYSKPKYCYVGEGIFTKR